MPILVGGAALTRKFTKTRIAPEYDGFVLYAKDAMDGLDIANKLSDPEQRKRLIRVNMGGLRNPDVMETGRRKKPLPKLNARESARNISRISCTNAAGYRSSCIA